MMTRNMVLSHLNLKGILLLLVNNAPPILFFEDLYHANVPLNHLFSFHVAQ